MQGRARKHHGQQHRQAAHDGKRPARAELGVELLLDHIDGQHQPGRDGECGSEAKARKLAQQAPAQKQGVQGPGQTQAAARACFLQVLRGKCGEGVGNGCRNGQNPGHGAGCGERLGKHVFNDSAAGWHSSFAGACGRVNFSHKARTAPDCGLVFWLCRVVHRLFAAISQRFLVWAV